MTTWSYEAPLCLPVGKNLYFVWCPCHSIVKVHNMDQICSCFYTLLIPCKNMSFLLQPMGTMSFSVGWKRDVRFVFFKNPLMASGDSSVKSNRYSKDTVDLAWSPWWYSTFNFRVWNMSKRTYVSRLFFKHQNTSMKVKIYLVSKDRCSMGDTTCMFLKKWVWVHGSCPHMGCQAPKPSPH